MPAGPTLSLTATVTQSPLLRDLAALAQPVTDWMLTYALHSTLLLAAAWVLGRALGERRLALQEAAWKIALVGGVVTASLQIGLALGPLGLEPLTGSLALTDGPAEGVPATAVESAAASSPTAGGVPIPPGVSLWPMATAAVWLALAFAGLAGLGLGYLRLHRCLADRQAVTEGALPALFGRLLQRAGLRPAAEPGDGASANAGRATGRGVRLTASPRLPVPIAWGVARREVSLPVEVVEGLSPYHQESILAHEISHLRRHDPAWLVLSRGIETLLFFQPMNRVARRRLQAIAEYRCDDEAVALTGRPLELARCLTKVAAWRLTGSAGRLVPGLVPGMATPGEDGPAPARQGSALARRVSRILDGGRRRAEPLPRAVLPLAAALLLTIALVAPGVTGQEPAPESPETPEAAEAPEGAEGPEAAEAPEAPDALEAPEAPEAPEAEGVVLSTPQGAMPAPAAAPAPSVPSLDGVPRPQAAPRPAGPLPRAPRLDRTAPTAPPRPRLHGLPAPAPPAVEGPTLPRTPAAPRAADQRHRAEETARRAMERAAREAERVRQRAMEGREAMAEAQAEAERALAEERVRLEAEMEGRAAELEQRAVEMARLAEERERLIEERHRATRERRQQAAEVRARAHREMTAKQQTRLEAEIAAESRRIEVESRHLAEESARIEAASAELRNLGAEMEHRRQEMGELDEAMGELREELEAEEGDPEETP